MMMSNQHPVLIRALKLNLNAFNSQVPIDYFHSIFRQITTLIRSLVHDRAIHLRQLSTLTLML